MYRVHSWKFRLYVAGEALNAAQALGKLTAFCRAHLPNHHEIAPLCVVKEPNAYWQTASS